jgi:hypothetical protein
MQWNTVIGLSALAMGLAVGIAYSLPLPSEEAPARMQRAALRRAWSTVQPHETPTQSPKVRPKRPWVGNRYLQTATLGTSSEAISQAQVFRRVGFAAQVFWTDHDHYVVTLGPFATDAARERERDRFLRVVRGAEAIAQPGWVYDRHIWPEPSLAQTF